jgi:hypothetical protein
MAAGREKQRSPPLCNAEMNRRGQSSAAARGMGGSHLRFANQGVACALRGPLATEHKIEAAELLDRGRLSRAEVLRAEESARWRYPGQPSSCPHACAESSEG